MGGPPQHLLWAALLTVIAIAKPAAIKDAPRRTIQREAEQKRITTGEDIKFNCPIDGTPNPIYEWTKDLEPLNEEGWERVRLVGRTLRIKQVQLQDQGTYVCTAVNGFGKEKYTFRLIVIDPLMSSLSPTSKAAPEFIKLVPVPGSQLNKPAGHSLSFKCQATGDPEPTVSWFKDGLEILEGHLADESRLSASRHQLHLANLSPRDAGTYTCAAVNPFGAVTTNWTINVIDLATPREPEFSPLEPSNTTVVTGETATMQCSGSSEVKPHIKWLRRIGEASASNGDVPMGQGLTNKSSTITFKGYQYVVLPATKVVTPGDGTFFTKLEVHDAQPDAEGVYVCTATNNFGLSFRQASLTVLPTKQEAPIVLVLIGLVGIGCLVLVVGVVCAVRRHQSKPNPPTAQVESALLPSVPPGQTKVHPPPSLQQPRYMSQPTVPSGPPSTQSVPHGRMVGPEGALLQYSGGVVHLPPSAATMAANGQPIIVYQDPSVYIATPQRPGKQGPPSGTPSTRHTEYQYQDSGRPSTQGSTTGRQQDYQYQHLDVI